MVAIPEKPSLEGLEAEMDAAWESQGVYHFDRTKSRTEVYSVDTPPPTVSGALHLGTVFGYVQFDAITRFQRMSGKEVFFPIGWDDNGLPTERRVQNNFNVRCDPSLPYESSLQLDDTGGRPRPVSRANFIDLCHELTDEDEKQFEELFRSVGMSFDWRTKYATIDDRCRRVAQRGFLGNLRRGEAYSGEAPTMWDVDFQTAVAQAEYEERPTKGAYHRISFSADDGSTVEIETTRPELLPACVAIVTHPDDARWRDRVGTELVSPVFGVRVPVVTHRLADPEKGSGVAMICTFGDTTDVIWWRELRLPLRSVIQRDGRFQTAAPGWLEGAGAAAWEELGGKTAVQARAAVVSLLRESGDLLGDPRPIEHPVKYFEKGDRPLEIVTSRQWYIRNGAQDEALRETLVDAGRQIAWHPDFMRIRYEHWVGGLNTDWLISRQRFFGVPFPIWYPVGTDGEINWDGPIIAEETTLPVDPQSTPPPGLTEDQRGRPGGFVGDPDVMDTWATSSLSPQVACGWGDDPDLFERTFPMDLRPQGPEIIRTWLFSTLLRSKLEHGANPWADVSINGWILDPDRKKMSKSKGNVTTPDALISEHGADGLRYWACSAAPGTDTAVDAGQMRVGRRLALKLLNASKFVLGLRADASIDATAITEPIDQSMLAKLAAVTDAATESFAAYQYQQAIERTERFFWDFCDDYLELVKMRAYNDDAPGRSAQAALALALSVLQRLMAPFLPFATEEAWSWWQPTSIHRVPWPQSAELKEFAGAGEDSVLEATAAALRHVRRAKSEAHRGMRTPVAHLLVEGPPELLSALRLAERDLRAAGVVEVFELKANETAEYEVTLAPTEETV